MNTLQLVFMLITVNVVSTKEANKTESILPEPKNAFKFEDQPTQSFGLIKFEDQDNFQQHDNLDNRFQQYNNLDNSFQLFDGTQNTIDGAQRIKFEDQDIRTPHTYDSQNTDEAETIKFEDNRVNQRPNHQKKKRRRKPKRLPNTQGNGYVRPYPGSVYPGTPGYPGPPVYPGAFGPGPIYPGQRPYQPNYPGPLYKPRPSATSAALSAVTDALTSIALYDDAQCVPRLLCEAAGGTVPGAGLLQSVTGLQPLLTLLAAYNGISSSPLFIFGRAVFLGMTSKTNPGTCRYAYPQCPNDPEQLVHYLNNHNGGFFRFFAAPELNQQQGVEQFYNQLSGQNYGFYQPQPSQQQNLQQGYGLQQNYQNHNLHGQYQNQYQQGNYQNQNLQPGHGVEQALQQGYGLQPNYQNHNLHGQYQNQYQQGNYQNQNLQPGYGLAQQYYNQNYNQKPSLYNAYDLYGQSYPHQKNVNPNKIQKRIQNIRNTAFVNKDSPKWSFPEDSPSNSDYNNVRLGKVLKFPLSNAHPVPASEGFIFPGAQSNREYPIDSIESEGSFDPKGVDDFGIYNQEDHGFDDVSNNNDGVRIYYIVRGNGDPNKPEIVRLGPGQTL